MSEFRYDPIKRTWVILAAERGHRPSQYQSDIHAVQEPRICPLCPGNESMTPPEVYAIRPSGTEPDGPGWQVRVVPNKYPALSTDHPFEPLYEGIHSRTMGFGVHEVIVESPVKNRQMVDMEYTEIAEVLLVLRDRMKFHHRDGRFKTVILFKNHGKEAGGSLVHSHSQMVALPMMPDHVASKLESFITHRDETNHCLMCEILEKEVEDGNRIILDESDFVVLSPFSASSPFQLNIVPETHSHDFSLSDDESLHRFAAVLGNTLRCLRSVLGEHPWNMVWHTAPVNLSDKRDTTAYHWFVEITPRLTNPAGFEMGSGFYINTVAPEECAEILRTQK